MKLIDKDKLEVFLNELRENLDDSDFDKGYLCAIDSIFGCYLDTLEVKEVDLDTEIIKWEESFGHYPASMGYKETAKHFFELGMKVSNKAQKGE